MLPFVCFNQVVSIVMSLTTGLAIKHVQNMKNNENLSNVYEITIKLTTHTITAAKSVANATKRANRFMFL